MNMSLRSKDHASVASLRRQAASLLRERGIESAELDARILLAHALCVEPARLLAAAGEAVGGEAQSRYADAIARRLEGEPVARIVGEKEFWSRTFVLSPEVLVPRPETETLVEAALAAKPDRDAPLQVLDLGTGSGALLAAILLERPRAEGVGVDRSLAALKTARSNLDRLGVGARARLVCGDWDGGLVARFDLVVSNPPYIASRDLAALPVEVRKHDPLTALDGGSDGLSAYRAILAGLHRLMLPDGVAILELGDGQEQAVANLARHAQLMVNGSARCDLAGRPRALILNLGQAKKKHLDRNANRTSVRPGFDPGVRVQPKGCNAQWPRGTVRLAGSIDRRQRRYPDCNASSIFARR